MTTTGQSPLIWINGWLCVQTDHAPQSQGYIGTRSATQTFWYTPLDRKPLQFDTGCTNLEDAKRVAEAAYLLTR